MTGVKKLIKFPKDTIVDISAYCDLCGDMVYNTTKKSTETNTWNQKNPYICKTYKIYCERCYMAPLLKIKELVTLLEAYQENSQKRTRKIKIRVEKDKKTLDEINNEFY
jgi:hypothetical protein